MKVVTSEEPIVVKSRFVHGVKDETVRRFHASDANGTQFMGLMIEQDLESGTFTVKFWEEARLMSSDNLRWMACVFARAATAAEDYEKKLRPGREPAPSPGASS